MILNDCKWQVFKVQQYKNTAGVFDKSPKCTRENRIEKDCAADGDFQNRLKLQTMRLARFFVGGCFWKIGRAGKKQEANYSKQLIDGSF